MRYDLRGHPQQSAVLRVLVSLSDGQHPHAIQAVDPMPLETAMGGLRYLAMLLSAAEANGIIGAPASGLLHD
jgi:hypothetical protein